MGLDLRQFGLPEHPFGSAMVTNVGTFGLPQGFVPLAWMYDVPLLILVGEVGERPVVEDGKVIAKRMVPITATIDHRYVDGWHVQKAMASFREYLAAPNAHEAVARAWQESKAWSPGSTARATNAPARR
jgi:pyruvate dehydrogenase E2 component (dihydrolipoamide acetyltransferase)